MRNCLVVEQRLFLGVAAGFQLQLPILIFQEDISALGPRQLQGDVEHGHQNLVEHAGGVEFAGGIQKQRELFEVRRFLVDLDDGNLAEKFAGRVGSGVRRIKENVGGIARAEFEAVSALQLLALDALSVHKRAV